MGDIITEVLSFFGLDSVVPLIAVGLVLLLIFCSR